VLNLTKVVEKFIFAQIGSDSHTRRVVFIPSLKGFYPSLLEAKYLESVKLSSKPGVSNPNCSTGPLRT